MLSLNKAVDVTGIPGPELLLLALSGRIPFAKDPDTRLIFFDSASLNEGEVVRNRYAKRSLSNM